ncbi:predicted protein [Sclerotinia sclerotiorum 1980 UF-70]|uniref:Uncharacterized protein n=1 Tax=Sclerotinia sclerotiorum (strain ATCC 18683 / 1980 / Ss-1) TaxID=665079 RepID=A7EMG7_SCLS1|nr:predicted protein [Sclerotinia sclerotiorum 1980 UF-70]EDO04033.1 predicted protein [Sclerotinia sclerotiorum 1980 UF-70]
MAIKQELRAVRKIGRMLSKSFGNGLRRIHDPTLDRPPWWRLYSAILLVRGSVPMRFVSLYQGLL